MTQSTDTSETKSFYTDSNRNVVVRLPVGNTELKLRPPASRDLSAISVVIEHGLEGNPISSYETSLYTCARLLTPVDELKKSEDAWKSRYESLQGYDIDAEDVGVLLNALSSFRALRATT